MKILLWMAKQNGKGVMDSSKYLTGFKETDMNVLIMIVRTALSQWIKGQIGNWLEFVSSINARSSGLETDPARHPFDILAAFVKTFTNDENVQTVKRIRKWAHCHKLEELLNATHPWPKTPEQVCN
jgi:RNA exonuclease 1